MKNISKKMVLGLCTATVALTAGTSASAQSSEYDVVEDSWIFVLQSDVNVDSAASDVLRAMSKGRAKGKLKHKFKSGIKGFSMNDMKAKDAKLVADKLKGVAYVVPNTYVQIMGTKNFTSAGKPSIGTQATSWGVTRVNGGEYKGNKMAWVVDTGVDSRHPDLRVHKGKSTSIIDGSRGLTDGQGHGTHVAGIIGAKDNGFGVLGVAPGVTIASVKVLDDNGKGTADDIIAGLDYAASRARSGDVINLSLGGGYNKAVNDAVLRASQKATVIVAAGNYRSDARNYSPGSAEGPNVMTVSAIDNGDAFSQSSNFGNPPIDCAAPGVDIVSTLPGNNYGSFSGTSMAAPHVAGLVIKGNVSFDGAAYYDPDGDADPICVF